MRTMDTSLRKSNSINLHSLCQLASHGSGGVNAISHLIHSRYSYFFQYSYNFSLLCLPLFINTLTFVIKIILKH